MAKLPVGVQLSREICSGTEGHLCRGSSIARAGRNRHNARGSGRAGSVVTSNVG